MVLDQDPESGKRRRDTFIKGTLILTVGGIVVKVIGSLNWIILSRVMGGEGIGLYQMAFPIYFLALSVSSAGIPVAISILTAEKIALLDYRGANRVFKISLTVLAITGLLFSLLLYFGAGWLIEHRFIRDPRAYWAIVALAPAIFFVTVLSSYRGFFQGRQMMTPTAVSQIVEQLFRVITMVILATMFLPMGLDYAAAGASFGACPGAIAGLMVLLFFYWRTRGEFQAKVDLQPEALNPESGWSIIRRILKLSLPVSAASIMLPIVSNLDLLIVPARLEVAGYTVEQATELFGYLTGMAVPLLNMSTILTASLATSLVPAVSEAYALRDHDRIYQRAAMAMRISNLITIPSFVGMAVLAEPIAQMLYNAPTAGDPIAVIAVAIFVLGIHQVTTGVLQGLGHTTIPVVNMILSGVVKVAVNWSLVALPLFGIKGAAWATVADIGVAAVLNMYFVHHYVGFAIDLRDTAKIFAASSIMGLVTYWAYRLSAAVMDNSLSTLAAIIAGGAAYFLVLAVSGQIQNRDVEHIPVIGRFLAVRMSKWGILRR